MPGTVVGDDDANQVLGGVVLCFDVDHSLLIHRLDRIVDQIDQHPPNLLVVHRDLGQRFAHA